MPEKEIFRTLPEQIAYHLRYDVLTGRLSPGEPLRETDISARFGVSRGPIREAFRQLTQDGLLVHEPNKGTRVAPNVSENTRSLLVELRHTIEAYVLETVFSHIGGEEIDHLAEILVDIQHACQAGDTAALVEHDLRFHQTLIQCHRDPVLFAIWQPIAMRMLMNYSRHENLLDSYYEHANILNAIREGDLPAAQAALAVNIQ